MILRTGLWLVILLLPASAYAQQHPTCQAFVKWLSVLETELAPMKVRTMDHIVPRAINLFRDEYFVPLFGKPFEATTLEERRKFYFSIRNDCATQQLPPASRKILYDWDVSVQGGFTNPTRSPALVDELANRKVLLARARELSEKRWPATREGFQEFDRAAAEVKSELATLWPREETEILAALTASRARMASSSTETADLATVVDAQAGVEGSASGGVPTKNDFVYIDAVIANGQNPDDLASPVDKVNKWLRDAQFKCLSTADVMWSGNEGVASAAQFGTKRFVIDCRSNCTGLRYRVQGRTTGEVWHYGMSREVPVLHFRSRDFATHEIAWTFSRSAAGGPPPSVRIHTWSNNFGDYGPGCRHDDGPKPLTVDTLPTDALSMTKLGAAHARSKDYEEAIRWYQQAAALGNAVAMCRLGVMHEKGQFFLRDFTQAYRWYQKCAGAGNAEGMFLFSQLFHLGRGVARNPAEALSWALKAANLGNQPAMAFVAESYRQGRGTAPNAAEADRWTVMSRTVPAGAPGAEGDPGKSDKEH